MRFGIEVIETFLTLIRFLYYQMTLHLTHVGLNLTYVRLCLIHGVILKMTQVEERILKWVLVDEAVELLGISRSTLFRKINKGEIEAKKDGSTRYVGIISDTGNETAGTGNETVDIGFETYNDTDETANETLISQLIQQIEDLKGQIDYLQKDIERRVEAEQRLQTIIMSMSQTQNETQKLLLDAKRSWWHKLFGFSDTKTVEGSA